MSLIEFSSEQDHQIPDSGSATLIDFTQNPPSGANIKIPKLILPPQVSVIDLELCENSDSTSRFSIKPDHGGKMFKV